MALSDCEKCWDTPCTCGYRYRNYSDEALAKLIASMLNYKEISSCRNILSSVYLDRLNAITLKLEKDGKNDKT